MFAALPKTNVALPPPSLTLDQARIAQKAKEESAVFSDLKIGLLALDASIFNSDHSPNNVILMNTNLMTETQLAVRTLWRIRRFFRLQSGLPGDARPPLKARKVSPTEKLYDPEDDTPGPPYDPTQQLTSLRVPCKSPSFGSRSHESLEDYEEESPRSRVSTPTSLP